MKKSDVFVIYDTVQFSDGFYVHRNRVRTNDGWTWLTIPVARHQAPINTIAVKNDALISRVPWNEHHWSVISHSYQKTPYFEKYKNEFAPLYARRFEKLADFNTEIIKTLAHIAGIKTKIVLLSELGVVSDDASERLALATQAAGGDTYLAGPSGGTKYEMREEEFSKRGVKVAHQEFHHPEYPQLHSRYDKKFEKNLAAIDALFNIGKLPL
ncbi:MAG: WbqC family protein [Parcubacteria group bacterium]|nr:WbqC family protein [Parcubacteria group bacterium]MBI3074951.1 WbqC family protein [Parcubacteria group bacterium]